MNARLRSLIIGNSFFVFGGSLLVPVYALFSESVGAGVQMTGILFAAKFVANAVADVLVMRLDDHMGKTLIIYRYSMVVRALAWLYVGFNPSLTSLLLVQIVTGLAEGFGTPAFSMLMATSLDKGKHIKQWAVWDFIKNPVIAIGGILSGFVVQHYGFECMFYIMGGIALIGACVPVADMGQVKRIRGTRRAKIYKALFARGSD